MISSRQGRDRLLAGDKATLVVDALSKLAKQFANKPDFPQLIRTVLLTLVGQFSAPSAFSLFLKPGISARETTFMATGKFQTSAELQALILTPEISRYFQSHPAPSPVSELSLPQECSNYRTILLDCGVVVICPLVHNDKLFGIIGLGKKVTGAPFTSKDIELLDTLVGSILPLVVSSYHFHEIISLSAWHLDILNNVSQGVFVFDSENQLLKVNTTGFDILKRYDAGLDNIIELQGVSIEEVFPRERFPDWTQRFLKANIESRSKLIEELAVSDGDTERFYDARVTGISGNSGFQTDFILTINDVTERKQAEEHELKLQQKLDQAERMESLGLLAGGVAHDLNNMLGPMVGYPELILLKLPEESPMRKQVQRIGDSAREAANVVQDLLTLARRGRYEMVPTDMNGIVEAYMDTPGFEKLKETHQDISVKLQLDKQIGRFMGSSTHLSKVFMNLVVNAFDAMPDGGELSIATSMSYIEALFGSQEEVENGDYILLRVRDTGMGIAAEDLGRIFEPYYSSKKMGSSGSGLGLSVVYGVVKDHKGYCDILSKVGEGTEFGLFFPVTLETHEESTDTREISGGHETILVVDDEENQRELARDILSSLGYEIVLAKNGNEAIDYIKNHSADLIAIDMVLEDELDGLDTYRSIIEHQPRQKAIIISGFSATDRVSEAQKLGAGDYVKKPYDLSTIASAVRKELDRA